MISREKKGTHSRMRKKYFEKFVINFNHCGWWWWWINTKSRRSKRKITTTMTTTTTTVKQERNNNLEFIIFKFIQWKEIEKIFLFLFYNAARSIWNFEANFLLRSKCHKCHDLVLIKAMRKEKKLSGPNFVFFFCTKGEKLKHSQRYLAAINMIYTHTYETITLCVWEKKTINRSPDTHTKRHSKERSIMEHVFSINHIKTFYFYFYNFAMPFIFSLSICWCAFFWTVCVKN
jgi:hypothetical protein